MVAMFKVTRWIALSGPNGEATVHYDGESARRAADAARKRLGDVRVYEVTGWPVQDLWDRPKRIGYRNAGGAS
jgi:hypothetical protein